ncbi:hypothetical protein LTR28_004196 [Elasticomyces elasticus]|nr:hypothetical protein LTR28_004196 [Elasticomyces elasticus]
MHAELREWVFAYPYNLDCDVFVHTSPDFTDNAHASFPNKLTGIISPEYCNSNAANNDRIAVGVFACVSMIAAVAGILWRRRRKRSGRSDDHPAHPEQPELDSEPKVELDTERPRVELEDSGRRELDGSGVDWIKPTEQREPIELETPVNRQV